MPSARSPRARGEGEALREPGEKGGAPRARGEGGRSESQGRRGALSLPVSDQACLLCPPPPLLTPQHYFLEKFLFLFLKTDESVLEL